MRNLGKILLFVPLLILQSCHGDILPDDGTAPTAEFVKVSLVGDADMLSHDSTTRSVWADPKGSGRLRFNWEKVDEDSENINNLLFSISDGETVIPNTSAVNSALTVTPHERINNLAYFQTVSYYAADDLERAVNCYSVSGQINNIEQTQNGQIVSFEHIPSSFVQSRSQDPSFLRDYMYMYAATEYNGNETTLTFNHIPAAFRFIITNDSPNLASLKGVTVSLSDASSSEYPIASASASVNFDWRITEADVISSDDTYLQLSTVFEGEERVLNPGAKYVAYAMALPLELQSPFKDKVLNFILGMDNADDILIQIDAEDFAAKNSGVFNWIGGNSYTVRINVGSDGKAHGYVNADNVIEVAAKVSGSYTLFYEGADGVPLQDYTSICTLDVNELAYYEDFIQSNVPPRKAEVIGIYDSEMSRVGGISIIDFKPEYTEPLYSFGLLSDVHVVPENNLNCIDNFQRALTFFNQNEVDFICICGDISEKGTAEEYAVFKDVVTNYSPSTPVYTTTGNHDCRSRGINLEIWKEYTGQDLLFEVTQTLPDGSVDHFLFLGMTYWGTTNAYLSSSITWLEEKMSECANERCFIITHMFFPDRSGNMNEIYPEGNWLAGTALQRLENLCDNHHRSVWFSGHSHWKWALQKYDHKANVHRLYDGEKPASGWAVHVPACTKPQDSNGLPKDQGGSRDQKSDESEGAIVHVYKDHIDILGLDLKNQKYLPVATYRLSL